MPCIDLSDGSNSYFREDVFAPSTKVIEAALCGILSALEHRRIEDEILSSVNYTEAGITRVQLETWWKSHKRRDAERRERERLAEEARKAKEAALAKLTETEKRILGLIR